MKIRAFAILTGFLLLGISGTALADHCKTSDEPPLVPMVLIYPWETGTIVADTYLYKTYQEAHEKIDGHADCLCIAKKGDSVRLMQQQINWQGQDFVYLHQKDCTGGWTSAENYLEN